MSTNDDKRMYSINSNTPTCLPNTQSKKCEVIKTFLERIRARDPTVIRFGIRDPSREYLFPKGSPVRGFDWPIFYYYHLSSRVVLSKTIYRTTYVLPRQLAFWFDVISLPRDTETGA